MKSALFSISSLGLGHATRSLVVLRSYAASHDLHIISTGGALAFLKKELPTATFYDYPDYPAIERGTGWRFYAYLVFDSLTTLVRIKKEHAFVGALVRTLQPEFIISDGRYGSYDSQVPSFIISHQISFPVPKGFGLFQGLADYVNKKTFQKFSMVFIPDYKDEADSLAGALSHHPLLSEVTHAYVGILSSYTATDIPKDITALYVVSGYLTEHRDAFMKKLLTEARALPGKKVFMVSDQTAKPFEHLEEYDIEIYAMPSGPVRTNLFQRAQKVVSRSGYTTIMDLVELSTPGVLEATPRQCEQEYLYSYLQNKGIMSPSVGEGISHPYKAPWKTARTLEKIRQYVTQYTNHEII